MKTLTVKQPWASLIVAGIKDIENRSWATKYRGPLLIHAGKQFDNTAAEFLHKLGYAAPDPANYPTGCIIGQVELIDCVQNYSSEWAMPNCYHWVLADAHMLPPTPAQGKLGLWDSSHILERHLC